MSSSVKYKVVGIRYSVQVFYLYFHLATLTYSLSGKMPISAFLERWENLPYDAQLLRNVAHLDIMDVQKYVYSYALYAL